MSSCRSWMVDIHVCISPVLLTSSFLSSFICLADLGNVFSGRSRGWFLSLSASAGRCGAVWSLTRFLCSSGATLGSKLGVSVGLKLHAGRGLVAPEWVSTSSLVLPYLWCLILLRGEAVVCVSVTPILVCRVGSAGKVGRGWWRVFRGPWYCRASARRPTFAPAAVLAAH